SLHFSSPCTSKNSEVQNSRILRDCITATGCVKAQSPDRWTMPRKIQSNLGVPVDASPRQDRPVRVHYSQKKWLVVNTRARFYFKKERERRYGRAIHRDFGRVVNPAKDSAMVPLNSEPTLIK